LRWAISHGFESSSLHRNVRPARDASRDLAGRIERRQRGNAGLRQEVDHPGRRHQRRLWLERSPQRRRPATRSISANATADRNLRRGLCRYPLDLPAKFAERLRKSGRDRHHRGLVQQAVDGLSGPVDQPGLAVGADQRRQRRSMRRRKGFRAFAPTPRWASTIPS
jgi:hypothetical protein